MTRPATWLLAQCGRLLPASQRDWHRAMVAELPAAAADGAALPFALGCLWASLQAGWQDPATRPRWWQGLAALCCAVPAMFFHAGCSFSGWRLVMVGHDAHSARLLAGSPADQALAMAYRSAAPALSALMLVLMLAQMQLCRALLRRDWQTAALAWTMGAMAAALLCAGIQPLGATTSAMAWQWAALLAEAPLILLLINQHRSTPALPLDPPAAGD